MSHDRPAQPSTPGSDRVMQAALVGGLISALLAIGLVAVMYFYPTPTTTPGNVPADNFPLRGEALALLLQFFLITATGGVLLFLLTYLRDRRANEEKLDRENAQLVRQVAKDEDEKREAQVAALQKIDGELNRIYRLLKTAKRRLRWQALECGRDNDGKLQRPFVFAKSDFEQTMGELLAAQIGLECLRDDLRSRTDLLGGERLELIRKRLRYAARFYHDVIEDFERGRVAREPDRYVAGTDCENILNFLSSQKLPARMPQEIRDCLANYTRRIDTGETGRAEQHKLMDEIEALRRREDLGYPFRFRAIADDCFAVASAEIRERIGVLQGWTNAGSERAVTNRSVTIDGAPLDA